jgi:hypothetical protein
MRRDQLNIFNNIYNLLVTTKCFLELNLILATLAVKERCTEEQECMEVGMVMEHTLKIQESMEI